MNRSLIPTRKGFRPIALRWYPNGRVTVLQWERITRERPVVEEPPRSMDAPPSRRRGAVDKQGDLFG